MQDREEDRVAVDRCVCVFVCVCVHACASVQDVSKCLCLFRPSGGFDPVPSGSLGQKGPSSSSSDGFSAPVPSL